VSLFAIDGIEETITEPGYTEPLTVDFLEANPHLVLDTKFFDEDFKDRLLASIEDLDAQLDGLLIESENFQALNLLQERYREGVKCIYIDPPYNTGGDGFLYKDAYQHSTWLTMMDNRLG
jgi:adenine-specific DNA-methyltransferase